MSNIILLTVFSLFVLIELKTLFINKTFDINEEASKAKQTIEEYRSGLLVMIILIVVFSFIFDVWAVVKLNIPILYIGTVIGILLNIKSLINLVKQLGEGKIVNKFGFGRVYHLVFDSAILVLLVRRVFGY